MPLQLLQLAEKEGIVVEFWSFMEPLEAVYWNESGQATIGLSKNLLNNRAHYRTVLAEELGHHFTTVSDWLSQTYFHYKNRVNINRAEYRALKWAAEYLLPEDKLLQCLTSIQDIAERFNVDNDLVKFKLDLLKQKQLA